MMTRYEHDEEWTKTDEPWLMKNKQLTIIACWRWRIDDWRWTTDRRWTRRDSGDTKAKTRNQWQQRRARCPMTRHENDARWLRINDDTKTPRRRWLMAILDQKFIQFILILIKASFQSIHLIRLWFSHRLGTINSRLRSFVCQKFLHIIFSSFRLILTNDIEQPLINDKSLFHFPFPSLALSCEIIQHSFALPVGFRNLMVVKDGRNGFREDPLCEPGSTSIRYSTSLSSSSWIKLSQATILPWFL